MKDMPESMRLKRGKLFIHIKQQNLEGIEESVENATPPPDLEACQRSFEESVMEAAPLVVRQVWGKEKEECLAEQLKM